MNQLCIWVVNQVYSRHAIANTSDAIFTTPS
jgi:hypothetical protein